MTHLHDVTADRPRGRGAQLPARGGTHRHHQAVRRIVACDRVNLDAAPGSHPRHPRRERGRQVDADEGADRPGAARCAARSACTASTVQIADPHRCRRARHRHGAPALQPGRGVDRSGRTSRSATSVGSTRPRPPTCRPDQRAVRPRHRPRRPHRRSDGRHAPAGRDHQVPSARPARCSSSTSRPRCCHRAESEFLFAALRRVVDDEGKAVALVSHKLPRSCRSPTRSPSCATAASSSRGPTAGADASTLARAMVGRDVVLRREHAAFGVVDVDDADAAGAGRARAGDAGRPAPVLRLTASAPRAATAVCCSTA